MFPTELQQKAKRQLGADELGWPAKVLALVVERVPGFSDELAARIELADSKVGGSRFSDKWLDVFFPRTKSVLDAPELMGEFEKNYLAERHKALEVAHSAVEVRHKLEELEPDAVDALYEEWRESKRFFSQPEADADYEYWAVSLTLSREEVVALCLGKDPRTVSWTTLSSEPADLPFVRRYKQLLDAVNRAIDLGDLPRGITRPKFKKWADRLAITYPGELMLNRGAKRSAGIGSDEERMRPPSKKVFYSVLLELAERNFGFDPRNGDTDHGDIKKRISEHFGGHRRWKISPRIIGDHFEDAVAWARDKGAVTKHAASPSPNPKKAR